MEKTALIFGVSGIVGRNLAEHLMTAGGWRVTGVTRHAHDDLADLRRASCDLMDAGDTARAVAGLGRPTHVFFATWSRQASETENCRVNGAMFRHALLAALDTGTVRHVSLVTGLKHYLGSFDNYAAQELDTPFTEDQPRVPGENFYYTQEDILFDLAERHGFTWSVARPHTIVGYAPGNAMNLGTSLAVYATLSRETGIPFVFPGSPQQYRGLTDMTDARLLARHLAWSATEPGAANKAFNVVNGDVFRWRRMWRLVADYFGITPAPYPDAARPLAQSLADAGPAWERIVRQYGLRPNPVERIAPWWHVDADLGRTQECVTDMSRSRELGFLDYQRTSASLYRLFDRLRSERVIP